MTQYEDLPSEVRNDILRYVPESIHSLLSADKDLSSLYQDEYNRNILLNQTTKYINTKLEQGKTVLNNLKHGEWKFFDKRGVLMQTSEYKLGKLHGITTTYSSHGEVKSRYTMANNLKNGPEYIYYNTGGVQSMSMYKDNIPHGLVITYRRNGNLASSHNMVNGLYEGQYTSYNSNGKVLYITTYKNDAEHGVRYSYVYNKHLVSQQWTEYIKSRKEGPYIEYYPNMRYECVGTYKKDNRDGTWTYYFEDGTIREIRNYKNGDLHGEQKTFNDKGILLEEGNRINDYRVGEWKEFYDSGNRKTIYVLDKHGDFIDEYKKYYPSGNLKSLRTYPKGDESDNLSYETIYYDNKFEIVKSTRQYIDDIPHGIWTEYYEDGKVESIATYNPGEYEDSPMTSEIVYYYPSGNKEKEEQLVDENLDGIYKEYYDNDTNSISFEGEYDFGTMIGEHISYYENGEIHDKTYHNDGTTTDYIEYYDNGKLKSAGKYYEGDREGSWTFYFENGDVESKGQYRNGKKTGIWTLYTGNKFSKGRFNDNNEKKGIWKVYDEEGKLIKQGKYNKGKKVGLWTHYFNGEEQVINYNT